MKIALCSSAAHLTPPIGYGSEVTAWYMVEELLARGHTVYLVAAEGSRVPTRGGLCPLTLNLLQATEEERDSAGGFAALFRECDVVHDMSSSHQFADADHESGHDRHLATINGISFFTPRHKHNVVVLSKAARHAAMHGTPAWGPDYPQFSVSPGYLPDCAVVGYGTDTEFYRPVQEVGEYVLYVGRPGPSKGVHVLLEVARRMPEQGFILAWRAEYPDHLGYEVQYRAIAKDLQNVKIVQLPIEGHHEAKRDLYRGAKVFVQATQYIEAFGLTAIESLACGTPVILGNRGSASEIVIPGSTGYLCDTVDEYVDAIHDATALSREACRMDAISRFDKGIMCNRYLTLYRRVMEGEEW